jgi:hypothetical protein
MNRKAKNAPAKPLTTWGSISFIVPVSANVPMDLRAIGRRSRKRPVVSPDTFLYCHFSFPKSMRRRRFGLWRGRIRKTLVGAARKESPSQNSYEQRTQRIASLQNARTTEFLSLGETRFACHAVVRTKAGRIHAGFETVSGFNPSSSEIETLQTFWWRAAILCRRCSTPLAQDLLS